MKKMVTRCFITCISLAILTLPLLKGTNVDADVDLPVLNSGFETISGGQPANWTIDQWDSGNPSTFLSATDQFHAGAASAKITSNTANDSRFTQNLTVEQNTWYLFDGWIKTIGVAGGDTGAHFDITIGQDWPQRSSALLGTNDWTEEKFLFYSGNSSQVSLGARLGFFGSTVTGTAFFDDIKIQKATPPPSGQHVSLEFFPEEYKYLSNINAWLAELDDAYQAHQDLVGLTPYGGSIVAIQEVPYYPGGEMVAGNPILWQDIYIPDKLKAVTDHNDLSFGPVHELGHVFDLATAKYYIGGGDGPINAEQWANFKVVHAADVLAPKYPTATLFQGSVGFVPIGQFSQKYFVEKFANVWIQSGRTDWQSMNGDTYTGLLYKIVQQVGWDPFKRTFRDFIPMTSTPPSNDLGKVELFANLLSKNSGVDLTPQFRQWGFPIQLSASTNMCSVVSTCQQKSTTCPDGFVAHCTPSCSQSSGCGSCTASCTGHLLTPPSPTLSLSATKLTINRGDNTILQWSSANATSCTETSFGGSTARPVNGAETVSPTVNATYSLMCIGTGGNISRSVSIVVRATTVTPSPVVSLTKTTSPIKSGEQSILIWNVSNADSCNASGAWSGSRATHSSQYVAPTTTSTYTLTCTGSGGTASASATISVTANSTPPPPVQPSPTPPPVVSILSTHVVEQKEGLMPIEIFTFSFSILPKQVTVTVKKKDVPLLVAQQSGRFIGSQEDKKNIEITVRSLEPVTQYTYDVTANSVLLTSGTFSTGPAGGTISVPVFIPPPSPPAVPVPQIVQKNVISVEKNLITEINPKLIAKIKGRILLQVEGKGEAWYLEPKTQEKYYLQDGNTAYTALRTFGLGVKNSDLAKIPVGSEDKFQFKDSDGDGLDDKLELALGTNPNNPDTDGDGFSDGAEVKSGHNPLGPGIMALDKVFAQNLKGRILLQVEHNGEAWYINPADGKRYYMSDGSAAYLIMRYLGLGITNTDLRQLPVGVL